MAAELEADEEAEIEARMAAELDADNEAEIEVGMAAEPEAEDEAEITAGMALEPEADESETGDEDQTDPAYVSEDDTSALADAAPKEDEETLRAAEPTEEIHTETPENIAKSDEDPVSLSESVQEDLEQILAEDEDDEPLSDDFDSIEIPDEISSSLEDADESDGIESLIPEGVLEKDIEEPADTLPSDELDELISDLSSKSGKTPAKEAEPTETDSPLAELKTSAAESAGGTPDSFEKLKTLSKRIIDGEAVDLGIDLKTEVSELLKLILETKQRMDEIEPTLATSKEHIPNVLSTLESVTETTEHATHTLMESADGLNTYYQEFLEEISDLEDLVYKKDAKTITKKLDKLINDIDSADSMGYNILHALEFQDITEQKIHKVISAVSDIGARIGAILGFIKLKQEQDPAAVSDASQDDIDKLLADFGLN